jgi:hypothetical protein
MSPSSSKIGNIILSGLPVKLGLVFFTAILPLKDLLQPFERLDKDNLVNDTDLGYSSGKEIWL